MDIVLTSRTGWIDALKGIAILGVVMIHSGGAGLPFPLGAVGSNGNRGVQVFFLISSYLAYTSLNHALNGERKEITLGQTVTWYIKKFARLIPLYYCAVMIGYLRGGNAYWLGNEDVVSYKNLVMHFAFLHGLFPHYANSIIGVEWYLGVITILYIFAPLIYKYIDSFAKAVALFNTGVVLCAVVNWYALLKCGDWEDVYIYQAYFGTFWLFAQLPVLLLGIVLYYVVEGLDDFKIKNKKLMSYSLLLFSILMIVGNIFRKNSIFMLSEATLFCVWIMCIIISQILYKCPLIDNCFFKFIGRNSYPIYLFHYFVLECYDSYIGGRTGHVVLDFTIKYMVVVVISLFLSVVLIRYVDAPIDKWLKSKWGECNAG